MKISSVEIHNFRGFEKEVVTLDDYTCLVGANGSGKSSVLCALNIFFNDYFDPITGIHALSEEDYHKLNVDDPIEVTVTFSELSPAAEAELSEYARGGKLVVSTVARFDKTTRSAELVQYGVRMGMDAFRSFFEQEKVGAKVAELKGIYQSLMKQFPELPTASTKDAMIETLRKFEAEHPADCVAIRSQDQFYGFTKGRNRLEAHIQWVFVPAVKDALSERLEEKGSAIGKLLARRVRSGVSFEETIAKMRTEFTDKYTQLVGDQQKALDELSAALTERLKAWAHGRVGAKLQWNVDEHRSVRVEEPIARMRMIEREFESELPRFGHGLQRSYIFALLHELHEGIGDTGSLPTLVLAIEEPEVFQHPPQQRHLARLLSELPGKNSQVIVATHSAYFVSGEYFESVRFHRVDGASPSARVRAVKYDALKGKLARPGKAPLKREGVFAKVAQAMTANLAEMFFGQMLVLVEGPEDSAYLSTYFELLGFEEELRRLGLTVVQTYGKSEMPKVIAIAQELQIPFFVVFDADASQTENEGSHKADNNHILALIGKEALAPFPSAPEIGDQYAYWPDTLTALVEAEIAEWNKYQEKAFAELGSAAGLKKNALAIGIALTHAFEAGHKSASLVKLCTRIRSWAADDKGKAVAQVV